MLFRYVSMWSDDTTWGGEYAPVDGESVWVPAGLNLCVDIDDSPKVNLVSVEGGLIFAPHETDSSHQRNFDAHFIMITGGYMEVGTEDFPYSSKLTITMHGGLYDPYIPIYGNKVIGVRYGTLDMHGTPRTPVWTSLDTTAEAGATQVTIQEAVDWQVGELVGIAPTGYERTEAEKRTITAIDRSNPDKPILILDKALNHRHFAETEICDSDTIDICAKVGLISKNVVLRGDPEHSSPNQFGANIFMHSPGDDSVIGRLSYIELTDVGQAFKVGRYAVHMHMVGAVHKSYAIGLTIHESFNRAFTIHGTHYLRLLNNFVYHAKGHTFFIEDAVETNNLIHNNLVMSTERSWSLLNTD
jgi:hypothetical protein